MWGHGPGDWLWMTVAMLGWWLIVILAIAWAVRAFGPGRGRGDGGDGPRDSMEDAAWLAYRRGEVDREGLMRLLEQIEESKGRPPHSGGT